MSIVSVRASVECDCCGSPFSVALDESYVPPKGWSIFDVAVDAVRGSSEYRGPGLTSSSVQEGNQLCAICTSRFDCDAAQSREEGGSNG